MILKTELSFDITFNRESAASRVQLHSTFILVVFPEIQILKLQNASRLVFAYHGVLMLAGYFSFTGPNARLIELW